MRRFVPALVALTLSAGVATTQELSWRDLARRPELWPTECRLARAIEFQSGTKLAAGDVCAVIEVRPGDIVLSTTDDGFTFVAAIEDSDALAVAQSAWSALTPEQQQLTYANLQNQSALWPYHVALTQPMLLADGSKIEQGTEYLLLRFEGPDLVVFDPANKGSIVIDPKSTDIIKRARETLVAEEPAPGRLLQELSGKLVDLTSGEPKTYGADDTPRLFAIYYSAGWCGPCRKFSPKLVEFYNQEKAAGADFEVVFVSSDKSAEEMDAYVKGESFPWVAVAYDRIGEIPILDSYRGGGIPQLLVLDQHGASLADSYVNGNYRGPDYALARLKTLLKQAPPKPADKQPADAAATPKQPATGDTK